MMKYNTDTMKALTDFLLRTEGRAVTVSEICEAVIPDGKGKSTVYRLISNLCQDGCLTRIGDGKTRHVTYRYTSKGHCADHLHLRCRSCGGFIHLDDDTTAELKRKIKMQFGF